MVPKELIMYEEDPYDALLVLQEKTGRIKSYQGFSKKDMLKKEDKVHKKSKPSKEHTSSKEIIS
jgi:hypothetical protein